MSEAVNRACPFCGSDRAVERRNPKAEDARPGRTGAIADAEIEPSILAAIPDEYMKAWVWIAEQGRDAAREVRFDYDAAAGEFVNRTRFLSPPWTLEIPVVLRRVMVCAPMWGPPFGVGLDEDVHLCTGEYLSIRPGRMRLQMCHSPEVER